MGAYSDEAEFTSARGGYSAPCSRARADLYFEGKTGVVVKYICVVCTSPPSPLSVCPRPQADPFSVVAAAHC